MGPGEKRTKPYQAWPAIRVGLRAFRWTDPDRRDYGEVRIQAIGSVAGTILHYVYAERGEVRRIITLRDANRRERREYRAT